MNLALQLELLARVFPPAEGWAETSGKALIIPAGTNPAAHSQPPRFASQHRQRQRAAASIETVLFLIGLPLFVALVIHLLAFVLS